MVCDQLSLGYISRVASPGEFPVGNSGQPIWFDEVHCTGNEKWLSACLHSGYGTNDCNHNEDVAIVCTGRYIRYNKHVNYVLEKPFPWHPFTRLLNK